MGVEVVELEIKGGKNGVGVGVEPSCGFKLACGLIVVLVTTTWGFRLS